MSTASSGLSSLSTYVPLAGGKDKMICAPRDIILYVVAAAITILTNCDTDEMTCKNITPVIAAVLVGVVLFLCKRKDCQLNLGIYKLTGSQVQNMLLSGLVGYAAIETLKAIEYSSMKEITGIDIPEIVYVGAAAIYGMMM